MNFRARLKKLERRREAGTGQAFRLVVRPVIGPTDLAKSTCQRTLCPQPDGKGAAWLKWGLQSLFYDPTKRPRAPKAARPRKQTRDATQELFDFASTELVEKRAVCPRISSQHFNIGHWVVTGYYPLLELGFC